MASTYSSDLKLELMKQVKNQEPGVQLLIQTYKF